MFYTLIRRSNKINNIMRYITSSNSNMPNNPNHNFMALCVVIGCGYMVNSKDPNNK